jgi:hypothetical protein
MVNSTLKNKLRHKYNTVTACHLKGSAYFHTVKWVISAYLKNCFNYTVSWTCESGKWQSKGNNETLVLASKRTLI